MKVESLRQQAIVLDKALLIFEERNRIRGDLWRESGPQRNIDMAKQKLARLERSLELGNGKPIDEEAFLDDALDCINFTAFVIRHFTDA